MPEAATVPASTAARPAGAVPARASAATGVFTIYCHTHVATGRRYVGQTAHTPEQRWQRHVADARRGSPWPFHQAIREFGPEAFSHRVLATAKTTTDADAAETAWIARLMSRVPEGFNLAAGGGPGGAKHPTTRAKMSEARRRAWASKSAEERAAIAQKGQARRAPGQHAASAKAQWAALTPEERAAVARKGHANRAPGQFSATWAAMSQERKTEIARKKAATLARGRSA